MDHGCVLVTYTLYDNTNQKSSLCEEVRHADPRISHVRRLGSGRAHICVPRRRHAPHLPAVVRHEHVVALQPVNATELGAEGRAVPGNAAQCSAPRCQVEPEAQCRSATGAVPAPSRRRRRTHWRERTPRSRTREERPREVPKALEEL
jgi:hypothetical protein